MVINTFFRRITH